VDGGLAAGLRALPSPPSRLCRPPLARSFQESGCGGGGLLPQLCPVHRAESAGRRVGGAAVAVPLVKLPGVCAGRGGLAAVVQVWYHGLGTAAEQRQQRWSEFLLGDDARGRWCGAGTGPSARRVTGGGWSALGRAAVAARGGRRPAKSGFFRNSMRIFRIRKLSPNSCRIKRSPIGSRRELVGSWPTATKTGLFSTRT
jgi:hypothetical protein